MTKQQLEESSTIYVFEHNDGRTHRGTLKSAIALFGAEAFICHNVCWRKAECQTH